MTSSTNHVIEKTEKCIRSLLAIITSRLICHVIVSTIYLKLEYFIRIHKRLWLDPVIAGP